MLSTAYRARLPANRALCGSMALLSTRGSSLATSSRDIPTASCPHTRVIGAAPHGSGRAPGRLVHTQLLSTGAHLNARSLVTCGPPPVEIDIACLPRHIVLLRHGQTAVTLAGSHQTEVQMPNHRIPLSSAGVSSTQAAGKALRYLLQHGHLLPHHHHHHHHQHHPSSSEVVDPNQKTDPKHSDRHHQEQQQPHDTAEAAAYNSNALHSATEPAASSSSSSSRSPRPTGSHPKSTAALCSAADTTSSSSSSSSGAAGVSISSESSRGIAAAANAADNGMQCFIYSSPYLRCIQTAQHVARMLEDEQVMGVQEDVQLREQDWCQQPQSALRCYNERLAYGRFFYRFPEGESAADVYDRLTIWQDHFVRDLCSGRFAGGVVLLVSHGLTLRVWLMRWLHWRVDQFLQVHNIPHSAPLVLSLAPQDGTTRTSCSSTAVKTLFELTPATLQLLKGVDAEMARYVPVADRRALLSWRPYWDMVPAVPGMEEQEAVMHEMMTVGYGSKE